jgi:hypothetical protein
MKTILGIIGIIASIIVGLYVGLWVMFIGGIIGLCKAIMALVGGKLLVGLIGWSVVKIMLASFVGYISFAVLFLPSYALVANS